MYCERCKVEVNDTEKSCPLCGCRLDTDSYSSSGDVRAYPDTALSDARNKKTSSGILNMFQIVISFLMGIAAAFKYIMSGMLPSGIGMINFILLPTVAAVTVALLCMLLFRKARKNLRKRFFV